MFVNMNFNSRLAGQSFFLSVCTPHLSDFFSLRLFSNRFDNFNLLSFCLEELWHFHRMCCKVFRLFLMQIRQKDFYQLLFPDLACCFSKRLAFQNFLFFFHFFLCNFSPVRQRILESSVIYFVPIEKIPDKVLQRMRLAK